MTTTLTRRLAVATALALGISLAGVPALAREGGPGRAGAGPVLRGALASLDLSADQKDKVRALFLSQKGAFQARRDEARAARQALREAASAADPDPAAVGKAFLRVRASRQAARSSLTDLRARLEAILSPEQKARFDGYLAAARDARRARMGGMGFAGRAPMRGGPPPTD